MFCIIEFYFSVCTENPPTNEGVALRPPTATAPYLVGETVTYSCINPNATLKPNPAFNQCQVNNTWLFDSPDCFGESLTEGNYLNLSLYLLYYTEACYKFVGPISVGYTAPFEKIMKRLCAVGNFVFDLRSPNFEPQTSCSIR